MKKVILLTSIIFYSAIITSAQRADSSIVVKKGFGGYKFYQMDERIKPKEFVKQIKTNPDAFKLLRKANANGFFGALLAGVAGGCIGGSLSLPREDRDWEFFAAGVGSFIGSIVYNAKSQRQLEASIDTYNEGVSRSNARKAPSLQLQLSISKVGLVVGF